MEADKGTNLFFAIYVDEDGKRYFESIPFNIAVERMKVGEHVAPDVDEDGHKLLFTLSPGDLVYVPEEGEYVDEIRETGKIYKMVSTTKKECHFIPISIAYPIIDTIELGSNNKAEKTWDGKTVKKECLKLQVNRLGIITKVYQ